MKLTQKIFMSFLLILSHFLFIFKVILLIIFTIILGHQNPGPGNEYYGQLLVTVEVPEYSKHEGIKHNTALIQILLNCSTNN